jgi:hypothetical protein
MVHVCIGMAHQLNYSAFASKWWLVLKSISTPPFSRKWELFFKNRPPWYGGEFDFPPYHGDRFLKKVLIFEKKGGCWFFSRGLYTYGGLCGQNLPYKFKKSYGDFQNRNFEKSHRTTSMYTYNVCCVLVPGQIWDRQSAHGHAAPRSGWNLRTHSAHAPY